MKNFNLIVKESLIVKEWFVIHRYLSERARLESNRNAMKMPSDAYYVAGIQLIDFTSITATFYVYHKTRPSINR